MRQITKIILFALVGFLYSGILPEDGKQLNYIQVFFKWDQIPHSEYYEFRITNLNTEIEHILATPVNSILILDLLIWDTSYNWYVCGLINSNSTCTEIYSFDVNPLPDYFPTDIYISNHDTSLFQEGITVMDFESLNFSGSLDKNGYPLWFADRNNFQQRFVFT